MLYGNKRTLIASLYQRLGDAYKANAELADELAAYKLTEDTEYEYWSKPNLILRIKELEVELDKVYKFKNKTRRDASTGGNTQHKHK
jgi:hypothetical protein